MLDALHLFIAAVEEGSVTAAAQRTGLTIATASRRLNALEQQLGCRLLHRSSRGLTLTREGRAYFDECSGHVRALNHRLDNLSAALHSLAGPLKILAPTNFATGPLDSFWSDFIARYPDIELTVEMNNDVDDLLHAQADLAIRIGPQPDSALVQRYLGAIPTVLVASPSLPDLATLQTPGDIQRHTTVTSRAIADWHLTSNANEQATIRIQHKYVVNDLALVATLVRAGAGLALLPLSQIWDDLTTGKLIRVLPQWAGQRRDIYLIRPHRLSSSARAQVFMECLAAFLPAQPWFENTSQASRHPRQASLAAADHRPSALP